ncbi:MAG TPA: hypothetical protein PKC24_09600 [Cyclobacteriaceae bacterium]|nr:hypothetical protein [Cyclobacteriaceae bacterium]
MKFTTNLSWKKVADSWQLAHGEEMLLSIGKEQKSIRPLYMEGKLFQIVRSSSWNNSWKIISNSDSQILQLKFGFWDSKGKIKFSDGHIYELVFKNNPSLHFIIRDLRFGESLISYDLDMQSDGRVLPSMLIHQKEIHTDKLFFLLALGMVISLHYFEHTVDPTTFILLGTA